MASFLNLDVISSNQSSPCRTTSDRVILVSPGCHSWSKPFCFTRSCGSGGPSICTTSETSRGKWKVKRLHFCFIQNVYIYLIYIYIYAYIDRKMIIYDLVKVLQSGTLNALGKGMDKREKICVFSSKVLGFHCQHCHRRYDTRAFTKYMG